MLVVAFALAATAATLTGGLFAVRGKRHLRRILGFTAGVLLGVVAFDVLPEVFDLVQSTGIDPVYPMIALVASFLLFHVLEKMVLLHAGHEDEYEAHTHPDVGALSALALIGHSFADGIAIGLAFQASTSIGVAVALAVVAHDFSDGINTAGLMLAHHNEDARTLRFVVAGALAPLLGALSTLVFTVSDSVLSDLPWRLRWLSALHRGERHPAAGAQRPPIGVDDAADRAGGGVDADRDAGGWGVRRLRAQPAV